MNDTAPSPSGIDARRPHLTADEYMDIARQILDGEAHPFYGFNLDELLSDIRLAHMNEVSKWRARSEYFERTGESATAATSRVWALVYAAGKRLTMRTETIRAALEGER